MNAPPMAARQPTAASGRRSADAVLIARLAAGATRADAAAAAGVGQRTVYRRLNDAAFARQVAAARAALVSQAVGRLADAASAAAATLRALLDAEPESIRLGAARAVLELGAKLRAADELEARIVALEQAATPGGQEGRAA